MSLTVINLIFVALFYNESLPPEKREKSVKNLLTKTASYINPLSLFNFSMVKSVRHVDDMRALRLIGLVNFLYLFIYSGLEFTLTFVVHERFKYDSVQQGKMFFFVGILMTLVQGGYVRRIRAGNHGQASIKAIMLLIPAFLMVALANTSQLVFYAGLALYSYSSAVVVQCITTMISHYGDENEKGVITGINRSLGALARAFGPIVTSIGKNIKFNFVFSTTTKIS